MSQAVLTFFCGKMGAGKSTKAAQIAAQTNAVMLSEDEWLTSLYPDKITSLQDYLKYSNRLKPQIKQLVQSILVTGTDVVMDFPANTVAQRAWFKTIFTEVEAMHNLIYIDVTHEFCLENIRKRGLAQPTRAATDTPQMFAQMTKYFVEPALEEGFNTTQLT